MNYKWLEKTCKFGIEKETLRVLENGTIANTKHPLKNKFKNPYITIDFGEQQIELISKIHNSISNAINEIKLLTSILYRQMNKNEYLWNYSMPIGKYSIKNMAWGKGPAIEYRKKLLKTSSVSKQLISGIHFNWSLSNEFTKKLSDKENNKLYFDIFKKYLKTSFVIKNLFGMSPTKDFIKFDRISYRQSPEGYNTNNIIDEDLKTYSDFKRSINLKIRKKEMISWRHQYTNIRIKPFNTKRIEWLEIRNFDLNYNNKYGICECQLDFVHKFLLFLMDTDLKQFNLVDSRESTIKIITSFKEWVIENKIDNLFCHYIDDYINNTNTYSKPNIGKIIQLQKELKKKVLQIPLIPIESMELSTQILIEQAYLEGMPIEIVSMKDNLIKIDGVLIEKATLTPFDSKKGLEIMSSKIKSNKFLKKHNFSTTEQRSFTSKLKAYGIYNKIKNLAIVIKPVNTNFSDGLTVFEKPSSYSLEQYKRGIDFAFGFDKEILVEKYVAGEEYRFLIINDKLIGILRRIPANVVGDGKHTIKELVEIKNKNKLRGTKYTLPLEKIKLNEIEINFLKMQNLSINTILKNKQQVFLRKNSNVSTGGDTHDMTNKIHTKYKKIAIELVKKLNIKVCGLDIIIPNIKKFDKYTILEMNWNPAIHIHTYPLVGKNRHPANAILKLIRDYK